MPTPDPSSGETPATLSTSARTLLFISIGLAGALVGYGVEELMDAGDSNWIQIAVEVVVPSLLFLIVAYVLLEDGYSSQQ